MDEDPEFQAGDGFLIFLKHVSPVMLVTPGHPYHEGFQKTLATAL